MSFAGNVSEREFKLNKQRKAQRNLKAQTWSHTKKMYLMQIRFLS